MDTREIEEKMKKQMEKEINNSKVRIAICYDFDKTLSPDDMQTFTLIPSFGIEKEQFWTETGELAKTNLMDGNLAWMYELMSYSKFKNKSLKKEYFNDIGKDVKLYSGVIDWFDRITEYAKSKGIVLEHYIISSGLKEIIEGSEIAKNFKRIYASSYMYNSDGIAVWPAQAINYTNKTQYIFRIAKGIMEEYDDGVNKSMNDDDLRIPYENIVYIGDSATDIPCMRLVKSKGGYSIGVYDPKKKNRKNVYELFNDGRLSLFAPADYRQGQILEKYIFGIIDNISASEKMKYEKKKLAREALKYKLNTELEKYKKQAKIDKEIRLKIEELSKNLKK